MPRTLLGRGPPARLDLEDDFRRGTTHCKGRVLSRRNCPRIAQVGPQGPPAPVASLRAKGAPRRRVPPMVYLDNPERRREAQPSDQTSANNYGFWPASTRPRDRLTNPTQHPSIGARGVGLDGCGGTTPLAHLPVARIGLRPRDRHVQFGRDDCWISLRSCQG